jgi:hypothetical protein
METSRRCQSAGCGQRVVQTCAVCASGYCGEHLVRAHFSRPGMPAFVVFDVCQQCLEQVIQEQHAYGRNLSHWHKMG